MRHTNLSVCASGFPELFRPPAAALKSPRPRLAVAPARALHVRGGFSAPARASATALRFSRASAASAPAKRDAGFFSGGASGGGTRLGSSEKRDGGSRPNSSDGARRRGGDRPRRGDGLRRSS